jgi:S-adenosylmethionine:tRNA-ribosyltransferase-isomerase (queuine synthetase)
VAVITTGIREAESSWATRDKKIKDKKEDSRIFLSTIYENSFQFNSETI